MILYGRQAPGMLGSGKVWLLWEEDTLEETPEELVGVFVSREACAARVAREFAEEWEGDFEPEVSLVQPGPEEWVVEQADPEGPCTRFSWRCAEAGVES